METVLAPNPLADFEKHRRFFLDAVNCLDVIREDGVEVTLDDNSMEEDDVFTPADNFYEQVYRAYSYYSLEPTEASVYSFDPADPENTLTEHPVGQLWPEMGRVIELKKFFEELPYSDDNKTAYIDALQPLNVNEHGEKIDAINKVLVKALGLHEHDDFSDTLGGCGVPQEFIALLARPFTGKVEGRSEEDYKDFVAPWNENMPIPLHPEDTSAEGAQRA